MQILTIATLSIAAALAIAAPAQAQTQTVMTDASFADMRTAAESLESVFVGESKADADAPYIEMKSPDGLHYVFYGLECTGAGAAKRCSGINLSLTFNLKSDAAAEEAAGLIDYAALSDYTEGKDLNLTRYLILDGGITAANLSANVEVFTRLGNKAWDLLTEEGLFPDS